MKIKFTSWLHIYFTIFNKFTIKKSDIPKIPIVKKNTIMNIKTQITEFQFSFFSLFFLRELCLHDKIHDETSIRVRQQS